MFGFDVIDAGLLPALLVALAAGVISFLSPCVLPIVPPYIAYMGGITLAEARARRGRALLPAAFFVLGLSTVFLFMGFTFSWIGQVFLTYQDWLARIAGVVIYAFGLHFVGFDRALSVFGIALGVLAALAGIFGTVSGDGLWGSVASALIEARVPLAILFFVSLVLQLLPHKRFGFMDREARIDAGDRGGSAFGAYVLGLAFAFGWTPCIGPILGAILSLAATEASVTRGTALLGAYAVGLGLPFLLVAAFLDRAEGLMARMRRHMGLIEKIMGLMLVGVGVAMATGAFSAFSWWLLDTFPGLAALGLGGVNPALRLRNAEPGDPARDRGTVPVRGRAPPRLSGAVYPARFLQPPVRPQRRRSARPGGGRALARRRVTTPWFRAGRQSRARRGLVGAVL